MNPSKQHNQATKGIQKMLAVVFFMQLSARSRKVNSKTQYIRTEGGEI